jgi:hypothetical protein
VEELIAREMPKVKAVAEEVKTRCAGKRAMLFVGGVKERPIAYKLGWASATTTTNARKPWKASWACSTSPGKSITP